MLKLCPSPPLRHGSVRFGLCGEHAFPHVVPNADDGAFVVEGCVFAVLAAAFVPENRSELALHGYTGSVRDAVGLILQRACGEIDQSEFVQSVRVLQQIGSAGPGDALAAESDLASLLARDHRVTEEVRRCIPDISIENCMIYDCVDARRG